ncbi:amidohydrolase family protein [Psychrobacter frigidicola]|uniref:Amidohydrolase family protein n=1 Tax=Psychrobacter frigidicola TaxID=45611 RepID=A0A5C7A3R5_9GAMM|nr:amidohydrolase family protein [Psychrobacter frigidicola]TXD97862.1 amidohydrolase family protein [Psychrobacter frigidicola]
MIDLMIRNARLTNHEDLVNISIKDTCITGIDKAADVDDSSNDGLYGGTVYDAQGNFVCAGFYESHIHLDKACILDRCSLEEGDLEEAVEETGKAKEEFTEEDVFERASKVIEMAIKKGTVGLRTFVETDSKTELRSFEAIKRARKKYAFAIDIEICAFAQDGLTTEPRTYELLQQALSQGADLVGGCPYKDDHPNQHIEMIFDLAEQFNVNVDFHLDFDLDPTGSTIPRLVEETIKRNYRGRVSIGHVTKLSAMDKMQRGAMAGLLKFADITLTVLPATDIYLNGRDYDALIPRGMVNANELAELGINTTIASNNILNAFTPYGDASLMRMANMYANIVQLSKDTEIADVFDMVGKNAAKLFSHQAEIAVGAQATLVVLEAKDAVTAIRTTAQALAGFKNGRQTFCNHAAHICFE